MNRPRLIYNCVNHRTARRLTEGRADNTVRNEVFLLSALFEAARGRPTTGGGTFTTSGTTPGRWPLSWGRRPRS